MLITHWLHIHQVLWHLLQHKINHSFAFSTSLPTLSHILMKTLMIKQRFNYTSIFMKKQSPSYNTHFHMQPYETVLTSQPIQPLKLPKTITLKSPTYPVQSSIQFIPQSRIHLPHLLQTICYNLTRFDLKLKFNH